MQKQYLLEVDRDYFSDTILVIRFKFSHCLVPSVSVVFLCTPHKVVEWGCTLSTYLSRLYAASLLGDL